MKRALFLILISLAFTCCDSDNGVVAQENEEPLTQEEEREVLNTMFSAIQSLAQSASCENSDDWNYVAFGSKACGGPTGYLAYATSIDTVDLFNKIEEHQKAEAEFNAKWRVISTCDLPNPPSDITCEDGKPVLVYQ